MLKTTVFCLSLLVLVACQAQSTNEPTSEPTKTGETKDPRYSITETSFGLVKLTDDYQKIIAKYGSENVIDEELDQFESGNVLTVSIVNKGKRDEFIVYWESLHETILSIEATNVESPFTDEYGIGIGTTLEELVKINGNPITCNGFKWEFGGMIISFNNGKLKGPAENRSVHYWLELKEDKEPNADILGEGEFKSDAPQMKKSLKHIVVNNIGISKL